MDIPSIVAAVQGLQSASELAKVIRGSISTLEEAELNYKLAELIGSLAEAKLEISNVKEVLINKDQKIRELEDKLSVKGKVIWKEPVYYSKNDGVKDGPFCQKCYDVEGNLVRLQEHTDFSEEHHCNFSWYECAACKNTFSDGMI